MADPFIGEIRAFAFNFAPLDWAFCNGLTINSQQNPALYSIIKNTFGGTYPMFAVPNLQGKVVIGAGAGPGLTQRTLGIAAGAATAIIPSNGLPSHNHTVNIQIPASISDTGVTGMPGNNVVPAFEFTSLTMFSKDSYNTTLSPNAVQPVGGAGGTAAHENRQPYLTLNYCICLTGIYPVNPN